MYNAEGLAKELKDVKVSPDRKTPLPPRQAGCSPFNVSF